MVAEHKVASVAAIQNFGSFVFASFAPIVTGWVVDTTHSFNLALVIAAGGDLCRGAVLLLYRQNSHRLTTLGDSSTAGPQGRAAAMFFSCAILSLRRLQPRAPCFIRRDLLVW